MLDSSHSTKNDRWEQELTGGLKPIAQPQPTGRDASLQTCANVHFPTPCVSVFGTPEHMKRALTAVHPAPLELSLLLGSAAKSQGNLPVGGGGASRESQNAARTVPQPSL